MKYDYKEYRGFLEDDKAVLKDPRGVQRTETLFHGINRLEHKYPSLYSLTEEEKRGLPSAYYIYMNSVDETEAALKLVGTIKHWRKLCNLKWFMNGEMRFGFEGILKWREDMAMRDISLAKEVLMTNAKKGDTAAARKLLDEYKSQTPINRVGRPRKGEDREPKSGMFDANKIAELHSRRFGSDTTSQDK